jgi:hypothetical protein
MTRIVLIACLLLLLVLPGVPVAAPTSSPCTQASQAGSECDPINSSNPLPVAPGQYPAGSTPIAAAGTGSTGAVTATLAGASGKTTYICTFAVSAIGGTATIGPITITGLIGSITHTYQLASTAAGNTLAVTYRPCVPASGTNTGIVATTTADGTATAVDLNLTGYQQ